MLAFLRGKASDRKFRLFAAACCWNLPLWNSVCWYVQAGEHYADGLISASDLKEAASSLAAERVYDSACHDALRAVLATDSYNAAQGAASHAACCLCEEEEWQSGFGTEAEVRHEAQRAQVAILKDIFGDPFRAPVIDAAWLTWNGETVPNLAESIYQERAFDRLLIMADALQDAGCQDAMILDHLRRPGPHFRGCWAVDLLMGRE
jgi:hypothetical protein